MIGNDNHGLLDKIDDLSGALWGYYSYSLEGYSLEDSGDCDSSDLLIAWLVATNRCTMDDLEAGLKVFKKIGDRAIAAHNRGIEFGPDDFVNAVMYEAKKEMEKEDDAEN